MKLALATLGFAIAVAGCSVNHLSDDFVCNAERRCASNRTCVDGFCVVTSFDAGVSDAPVFGDAAVCPSQCTSCNPLIKSCTINCDLNNGACAQKVTCPTGWSCNISCSTPSACGNGINCANSRACTITCSGRQSCRGITCGIGPCSVDCAGNNSCQDIQCGSSCACDVVCRINAMCSNLACTPNCESPFGGCSSTFNPSCNTCL